MRIYTSYFDNISNIPDSYTLVSVANPYRPVYVVYPDNVVISLLPDTRIPVRFRPSFEFSSRPIYSHFVADDLFLPDWIAKNFFNYKNSNFASDKYIEFLDHEIGGRAGVIDSLRYSYGSDSNIVLLGVERPGEFGAHHVLAKYLTDAKHRVPEFTGERVPGQLQLFSA